MLGIVQEKMPERSSSHTMSMSYKIQQVDKIGQWEKGRRGSQATRYPPGSPTFSLFTCVSHSFIHSFSLSL